MRSNVTTSVVVTLVLSQEEAAWLHDNLQNPLHGQSPCTKGEENPESEKDYEMRFKFWNATKPT